MAFHTSPKRDLHSPHLAHHFSNKSRKPERAKSRNQLTDSFPFSPFRLFGLSRSFGQLSIHQPSIHFSLLPLFPSVQNPLPISANQCPLVFPFLPPLSPFRAFAILPWSGRPLPTISQNLSISPRIMARFSFHFSMYLSEHRLLTPDPRLLTPNYCQR